MVSSAARFASPDIGLRELTLVAGTAESRDPDAVGYLRASGLSMSSVVLGLLDQSDDCIKILDANGRLRFMNCNGKQAMEIEDFAAVEGRDWTVLWPDEARELVARSISEAKAGRLSRFEAYCPTVKGTRRWWEVTVSPIQSPDGKVAAILSTSRDVTRHKIQSEALETLLAEMKHRLRNAYTVGAALSTVTAREYPEGQEMARTIASRLSRLADVQSSLIDSRAVSLDELIVRTVTAFDAHGVVLVSEIPDVLLSENAARALALVLGELCTNSLKHGSLGGRGTVRIQVSIENGCLNLGWIETHSQDGGGATRPGTSSGLGKGIMHTMLATVSGTIEDATTVDGYRASITMKL